MSTDRITMKVYGNDGVSVEMLPINEGCEIYVQDIDGIELFAEISIESTRKLFEFILNHHEKNAV